MTTYLYDGSFLSLLTLIATLFKLNIIPDDIKSYDDYIPNLLDKVKELKLNNNETYSFMNKVFSKDIMKSIYYVYLSTDKNKEMIIYHFLKKALIYKNKVFLHRNIEVIDKVLKLNLKVSHEAHKIKGFLRFKKMMNNFYYAQINPTSNCLEIVALHFKKRLKNELWIIKDANRKIYALYDLKNIIYLTDEDINYLNLDLSSDEEFIEDLWKNFFKTISIKERKNKKCQMNFMPKKYWNYIIEMEDEL